MFSFIRKHWAAYLIGAAVAVALGFGASYVLGIKWSTPPEVRAERLEEQEKDEEERNQLSEDEGADAGEPVDDSTK